MFSMQYDPDRRKKRHLYYHYLDEEKPDKLIARVRKSEAHDISFKVSCDYKYLLLRGSRMLCIANIENLEETIRFKLIFEINQDVCYVSNIQFGNDLFFLRSFIFDHQFKTKTGICWK